MKLKEKIKKEIKEDLNLQTKIMLVLPTRQQPWFLSLVSKNDMRLLRVDILEIIKDHLGISDIYDLLEK